MNDSNEGTEFAYKASGHPFIITYLFLERLIGIAAKKNFDIPTFQFKSGKLEKIGARS